MHKGLLSPTPAILENGMLPWAAGELPSGTPESFPGADSHHGCMLDAVEHRNLREPFSALRSAHFWALHCQSRITAHPQVLTAVPTESHGAAAASSTAALELAAPPHPSRAALERHRAATAAVRMLNAAGATQGMLSGINKDKLGVHGIHM